MKRTIAVLFGGQSSEHEVSLTSARSVIAALDPERYDLVLLGITKDGRWLTGPGTLAALAALADQTQLPKGTVWEAKTDLSTTEIISEPHSLAGGPFKPFAQQPLDVVFPVLHGPMGEDGTVQGLLELAGLAYVGCGVAASAVGMDKALMKAAFAAADLPLLPWQLIRRHLWQQNPEKIYAQLEENLHYPLFVKPANMGSSIGVSKATNRAELAIALAEAARYDRRIVVEQGIVAREIEVGILGNEEPIASIPGEIVPGAEWYTYQAKYLGNTTQLLIPAPLETTLADQAQELALRAFAALDGAGLARVDFLLDRQRNLLWLNEVNTLPGFTPGSMYAKMWAASGLSYGKLVDRLIELALERQKARRVGQASCLSLPSK